MLRRQKIRGLPAGDENVYRFEFQDGRFERRRYNRRRRI